MNNQETSNQMKMSYSGKIVRIGYIPPFGNADGYFAVMFEGDREPHCVVPQNAEHMQILALTNRGDSLSLTVLGDSNNILDRSVSRLLSAVVNGTLEENKINPERGELPVSVRRTTF
ncbi:hypothetical protein [Chromobacterium haemolyticum]|uniref:hypothetical protein n=1 Tax=Chromobacterium haemolyticum TaxID=394935 RepID=UPI002448D3B8|nr:hypothetical protein [Chromobacterium haemolyticum]MDH0342073.1 hypothetical protein [Chromobacterium haemolyticum]